MRTCITSEGNCTRCCQVIGLGRSLLRRHRQGRLKIVDGDKVLKLFKKVSKRRAKKINPYAVKGFKDSIDTTDWFTCKNLDSDGCKDQEGKPQVCKSFVADLTYSPTCIVDSRVFFRTKEV